MRIALFQTEFSIGGIQRSLLTLLSSTVFKNDEVDVYLFGDAYEQAECFPENVQRIYLKPLPYLCRAVPFDIARIFTKRYRNLVADKMYDIAIDFNGYSPDCAAAALAVNAKKRIIWVHNDYLEKSHYSRSFRYSFSCSRRKYGKFDVVVAVSEGALDSLKTLMGDNLPSRQIVVPNLINTDEVFQKAEEYVFRPDDSRINMCGVGRLDKIKGYDLLIEDFADARESNELLECYLIGDGPERNSLEKLAQELGVADSVHFLGKVKNPYPIMNAMDAFCHEALYEGQGIAIWEAKALGLEVIVPKRMEKYNRGIVGSDNIVGKMASLDKKRKPVHYDHLERYNSECRHELEKLLDASEADAIAKDHI